MFRTDWSLSKDSRKELKERFENDNFLIYVAETESKVVGYAICEIEETPKRVLDKLLIIHTFFVTKDYRRQGVGSALFEKVMDETEKRGVKRIRLETLINNLPAVKFYEKLGMQKFSLGMELDI